jgi:NADPH:quinone reductase-like Zn-dependent oxidoreductase
LYHTPSGISDVIASALPIAGLTADAALSVIGVKPGETVLIGGAAGGVGTFAVQLAKLAGATVIGTGSEDSFDYLRTLGALPVTYGPGLADRVRQLAPHGVDAATALVGTETIDVALALGISPARISAIAAGPNPPGGVHATGGAQASPGALERITDAIRSGKLTVPIAATFPIERTREAVTLQRGGHVHGKVVITLAEKDS